MVDIMSRDDSIPETSSVLEDAIQAAVEGATGLGVADRKQIIYSLGRLLQRCRTIGFLGALKAEWEEFRQAGRIKDDYARTEQHQTCLQELLDALDRDMLDEHRFDLLKRIFLVTSTETVLDRESVLPVQYMQICRRLTSGEVCVLLTAYRAAESGYRQDACPRGSGATGWCRYIAEHSGLQHEALVMIHEEPLMKKQLLSGRVHSDRSGVHWEDFRLTDLTMHLCRYIAKYDELAGDKKGA